MASAFTPGLRHSEHFVLRRERELSVKGKITVQPGAKVSPQDVIGRGELPGDLIILRLTEQLGIQPEEVMSGLKVKLGQKVDAGELICEHSGLFGLLKSRFTAPQSGVIELITEKTGHVGLRLPSRPIELKAYVGGTVVDVVEGRSAVIESHCAFIQGIFGIGGERYGKLKKIAPPDALIDVATISDASGCVLYGGRRASGDALIAAARKGALGFVTGSVDDQALKSYLGYDLGLALTGNETVSMSVIITEGFGDIAMSGKVFELLSALEGRQASINGATQVRAGALRPEIIVQQEQTAASDTAGAHGMSGLEVGSKIRLIRVPYFGMRGEVVELPHEPVQIETGAFTRVLRARLEDGRTVTVPRANVEL